MSGFEWFLLVVVVIVVPLVVAAVVTLWSIDQANKRKRSNRKDSQIGVKRKAALTPEEVEARKAERARRQHDENVASDTAHHGNEDRSGDDAPQDYDTTDTVDSTSDSGSDSSDSGGDGGGGDS